MESGKWNSLASPEKKLVAFSSVTTKAVDFKIHCVASTAAAVRLKGRMDGLLRGILCTCLSSYETGGLQTQ